MLIREALKLILKADKSLLIEKPWQLVLQDVNEFVSLDHSSVRFIKLLHLGQQLPNTDFAFELLDSLSFNH